ncbi:MAG: RNA 2',3'-cyclic phosphodiesterase [Candidatus Dormibacteria bacterium]
MAATLFLAIPLSEGARQRVAPVLSELGRLDPALRPVRPDGLHLTLHFLGPTADDRVPEVAALAAMVAAAQAPFAIELGGWGGFPSRSRPQVVWLGPTRGEAELGSLAAGLAQGLVPLAPQAGRRWHGHCTLARVAAPLAPGAAGKLADLLAGLAETRPCAFSARSLALLETVPQTRGANRYRIRQEWRLGGA